MAISHGHLQIAGILARVRSHGPIIKCRQYRGATPRQKIQSCAGKIFCTENPRNHSTWICYLRYIGLYVLTVHVDMSIALEIPRKECFEIKGGPYICQKVSLADSLQVKVWVI